jgi:hypothetical protein
MLFRVSSGVVAAVARTPNPPALQTAATSSGSVIQFMPASIIGCFIPNTSVMRVFIMAFSPFAAYSSISDLLYDGACFDFF